LGAARLHAEAFNIARFEAAAQHCFHILSRPDSVALMNVTYSLHQAILRRPLNQRAKRYKISFELDITGNFRHYQKSVFPQG
jgi:hypothetical protein